MITQDPCTPMWGILAITVETNSTYSKKVDCTISRDKNNLLAKGLLPTRPWLKYLLTHTLTYQYQDNDWSRRTIILKPLTTKIFPNLWGLFRLFYQR